MIDPKLIRHETQIVLDSLSKRKNDFELDDYLLAEEASRKIQTEVENLRSTKNKLTKKIGSSQLDEKAKGKIVDEVHEINDSLKDSEAKLEGLSVEVMTFFPLRSFEWMDWLFDALGVLVGFFTFTKKL